MRLTLLVVLTTITFIILTPETEAKGGRGGGGGRSGGRSGRGSSGKGSRGRGSSTIKKAVAIGAAGVITAKVAKSLKPKFPSIGGYGYDRWEDDYELDENIYCQNDDHCTWISEELECDDIRLRRTRGSWFGLGTSQILGECSCPGDFNLGFDWDTRQCNSGLEQGVIIAIAVVAGIVGLLILCAVCVCCCCAGVIKSLF